VYATLIRALTGMGKHDSAVSVTYRPVPEQVLQSRHGLHYLHARGQHYLAIGNWQAALHDFLACGKMAHEWGLDAPGLVPWRLGAAETHLMKGDREQARALVNGHLDRCAPHGPAPTLGAGLRLLAATHSPRERLPLLRRAIATLDVHAADRYQLCRALIDLAMTYRSLGEYHRARKILPRAEKLARECQARPLLEMMRDEDGSPDLADSGVSPRSVADDLANMLSRAERRVAALAAAGYANRDISEKLFITTSTVEQHLTRIYRKLGVASRADLPPILEFVSPDGA
jgi:ATP/maltotriose-dependent transcriptional regulator MalT